MSAAQPRFADAVVGVFGTGKHKTLATLRRDGSPRISGIEAEFADGECWLGMMPGSVKLGDVRRDPRLALHSPTADPPTDSPSTWRGEAKIAGRAVETPRGEGHWFRVDISEVVLTTVGTPADHLVIESWHPDRGYSRVERR